MSLTNRIAKHISNYNDVNSIGSKFRSKRIVPLYQMIEKTYRKYGHVNLVDIGGTKNYWDIVPYDYLEKNNVKITIVNLEDTALEDQDIFSFIRADACNLFMFDDKQFHIAHSNSVIEHVGSWPNMLSFAKELRRVANAYYVQTPNYWFPIEPHFMTPFLHWFPKPMFVWFVRKFQLGHNIKASTLDEAIRIVDRVNLLNKEMFCSLFYDSSLFVERLMLLPKSFIAIKHER